MAPRPLRDAFLRNYGRFSGVTPRATCTTLTGMDEKPIRRAALITLAIPAGAGAAGVAQLGRVGARSAPSSCSPALTEGGPADVTAKKCQQIQGRSKSKACPRYQFRLPDAAPSSGGYLRSLPRLPNPKARVALLLTWSRPSECPIQVGVKP